MPADPRRSSCIALLVAPASLRADIKACVFYNPTGPRPRTSCPHCALVKGNHISSSTGFSSRCSKAELRDGDTRLFLWRPLSQTNYEKLPQVGDRFLFTCRCFTRPVFSQRRRQFRGILAASRLCEECLRASLSPQLLWFQNLEFTGCFFFFFLATHCQGAAPVMSLPATITALSKQF